jgi:hypothetical protein
MNDNDRNAVYYYQILNNFKFMSNPQEIYYRVTSITSM